MIRYPSLPEGAVVGVTAPSSGMRADQRVLLERSIDRLRERGFGVVCGETPWTQEKAKSAPAAVRAREFNAMMSDEGIDLIVPPWGGELLIEILERIEWEKLQDKWVLGYSDTSLLLLALTLRTGLATAHGTNLIDLRGETSDETTAMWRKVLATSAGQTVVQHSSSRYQKEWRHGDPSPCVFHLTEPTCWRTVSGSPVSVQGRLLGGCIDVIRHLIGTPFGDLRHFQTCFIRDEPIVWYLENCELTTTDLRRSLVQMKLAGWLDNCAGLLFGRSCANAPVEGYEIEDVYRELYEEWGIPVIYDIDCGHVPPQITFVNGAFGEIEAADGRGVVKMRFLP